MKRIRLPDGSIGQFPDSMPDSEIERVLQAEFGTPKPTPMPSRQPPSLADRAEAYLEQRFPALNKFGNQVASVGESIKTGMSASEGAGGAIGQILGFGGDVRAKNEADLAALRKRAGLEGYDVGRTIGTITNPSNLATMPMFGGPAKSMVGRAFQGSGISAAQSLLSPVRNPSGNLLADKASDAGVSAALGFAATPGFELAAKGAGAVARPVWSAVKNWLNPAGATQAQTQAVQSVQAQLADNGMDFSALADEVKRDLVEQATKALSTGGRFDAAAAARAADFKAAGMRGTRGQITNDPAQFAWEMNKRAAFPKLAQRFQEQNTQLVGRLTQLVRNSGKGMSPVDAGETVLKTLKTYDDGLSAQVRAAYEAAEAMPGVVSDVPMTPLAQRLGDALETYGESNLPQAVRKHLESFGLMGGKQTKVFTVLEADKLLKIINANHDPMNQIGTRALTEIRRGLGEALDGIQAPGGSEAANAFKTAVALARERFKLHDATPSLAVASKAIDGKGNMIPGVFDGEDFFQKFLKGGGIREIESMMKVLPPDAQNILRRQILNAARARILNKETDIGKAMFSHAGAKNVLDSGNREVMQRVLTPEQMGELSLLGRVSGYTSVPPAGSWVNTSNSATELIGAGKGLLDKIPGVPFAAKAAASGFGALQARNAVKPPNLGITYDTEMARYLGLLGGSLTGNALRGDQNPPGATYSRNLLDLIQ